VALKDGFGTGVGVGFGFGFCAAFTVTLQLNFFVFAFAVITAVPFFTAVIFPLESTRAIFGLEEEYFTFTVVPVNLMALDFFSVNVSDVLLSFGVSTFTTHLYVFLLTFA